MWKPYRSDADYSYTLGAYPTCELIQARPAEVQALIMHPSFSGTETAATVGDFAAARHIPLQIDAKAISRLSPRENCYLIGIFHKYQDQLAPQRAHLLLVQPSNRGNVGTIMRTMLGFGLRDLAVVRPAADIFHPQTVRASMGALFALRHSFTASLQEYREAYAAHLLYPLMLQGRYTLSDVPRSSAPYTLILGNEATGLDPACADLGYSIRIEHDAAIDSLNLTVAAGIALESFYRNTQEVSHA